MTKLFIQYFSSFEYPVEWGIDLQTEHERYITEEVFGKPVFVTDYPKEIKAFYMRLNDDNKTVGAMDLLVPGVGEIIGGSQREERYDVLASRMKESGLEEKDYWWYLDLRKYGGVKHSRYRLGFERIIMYLTGDRKSTRLNSSHRYISYISHAGQIHYYSLKSQSVS